MKSTFLKPNFSSWQTVDSYDSQDSPKTGIVGPSSNGATPVGISNPNFSDLVPGVDYAPDEVIVKFKPGTESTISVLEISGNATLRETTQTLGIQLWGLDGITVEDAIALYSQDPSIEYIEPNYRISVEQTPNDPSFSELWGLHNTGQSGGTPDADIDAPEAWDIQTGDGSVIVGVIDTGVDYTHSDLMNNIWTNSGETPGNDIDDDSNGFVDDYYGWDFAYDDSDPFDGDGHGTHVSGTIAAEGDNGIGVVGVNWDAQIMPIKFLDDYGGGWTFDAIQSVEYATLMGADLTNNSWGGGGYSQGLYDAIAGAGDAGQLFIASAGNYYGNNNDIYPHYPSSYDLDNIIAVAATDRYDNLSDFSNYGPTSVDLGAPGSEIYSTIPDGGYAYYDGTSMATPHVSGVAALVWAEYPDLTAAEVKEILLETTDPIPALEGLTVSGGRLNAYNALIGANAGKIEGSKWNDLDQDGIWDGGEPALADWTIYLDSDNDGQLDPGELSTTTDTDGSYAFRLQPGTYIVAEVMQPGWSQTYPSSPGTYEVELEEEEVVPGRDFGNFLSNPAEIRGSKWHDVDGDGEWDGDESALSDWTIYLNNGEFSTVTDSNGNYAFTGLVPDIYIVSEELPPTWEQTYPGGGDTGSLLDEPNDTIPQAIASGLSSANPATFKDAGLIGDNPNVTSTSDVDFIELQLNAGDSVTIDIDADEFGSSLDSVLRLFDSTGTQVAVSDDNPAPGEPYTLDSYINFTAGSVDTYYVGVSSFANFYYDPFVEGSGSGYSSGNYDLEISVGGGGTIQPISGFHTVELEPDEIATGIDFGNRVRPGEIHGKVWSDLDGDGQKDTGEPGMSNSIVYLDDDEDGQLDPEEVSTPTDIYGNYAFTDLERGTYVVAEVMQPNWHQTCPGLLNSGFEMGDFTGWQILGNTTIETDSFGSGPIQGTYQALATSSSGSVSDTEIEYFLELAPGSLDSLGNGDATSGSAIARSLTVSAGDQVSFDWNFLTNEDTPTSHNDFAFVYIASDGLDTLANTHDTFVLSPTSFYEETEFDTFSYTFPADGTFTLGVGVVDVEDTVVDSGLLVDNFLLTISNHHTVELAPGDIATDIDFGNHQTKSPTTIYLTKGDDVETIVDSPVIVYALRGNDLVDGSGSEGGNRFYGGQDDDTLIGNFCDQLFGGPGDDDLTVVGGAGNNTLFGENGQDTLRAGVNDWLNGGLDDDILIAGQQDTTMTGEQGNDQFWITEGDLPGTPHAIADFEDTFDLLGVGGFNQSNVNILESDRGTLIQIGGIDTAILTGVSADLIDTNDFIFA
jgi:subtilisin family serine protease